MKNFTKTMAIVASAIGCSTSILSAQVTPIQSSLTSDTAIGLSGTDFSDHPIIVDDQLATNNTMFSQADAQMDNVHGVYAGSSMGSLLYSGADAGAFDAELSFGGVEDVNAPSSGSYSHSLNCIYEYEFKITGDGSALIDGTLFNTSTVFESFVNITVGSFHTSGSFSGNFFNGQILDTKNEGKVDFDFEVPLTAASGHYLLRISLVQSSIGQRNQPEINGILNSTFTITAPITCPADLTGDGMLNFFDVSAFLSAFSSNDPIADLTGDGLFNFFDVSAFLSAFAAGCP